MNTRAKSWLVSTTSAFAVALMAFSLSVGGSRAVRAGDPEALSYAGQETVLVPVKDLQALEQRVIYLEERVAALTESWQHIDTHRLCVSDQAGATETCITKPQLDALLAGQAQAASAAAPAAVVEEAKPSSVEEAVAVAAIEEGSETTASPEGNQSAEQDPGTEPVAVAVTEDMSEPAASVVTNQLAQKDSEPEPVTGSIATIDHPAELSPAPQIEPLSEGDLH